MIWLTLFTHVEYCDMHYVYGYCDGNASAAVNEYRRRYPERIILSKRVFTTLLVLLGPWRYARKTAYIDHKKYSYERFFIGRGKIGVNFKVSCHWTGFRRYEVFSYHFSFSHFSSCYRKMWGTYVLQDYMKVSQTSKCFIQTISIVQFKAKPTTSVC